MKAAEVKIVMPASSYSADMEDALREAVASCADKLMEIANGCKCTVSIIAYGKNKDKGKAHIDVADGKKMLSVFIYTEGEYAYEKQAANWIDLMR